jgi:hypothetical protein
MATVAFNPLDVVHPRFALHEVIGKGASGVVVLAKDLQTGRPVAVKLLERGQQVGTQSNTGGMPKRWSKQQTLPVGLDGMYCVHQYYLKSIA